VQYLVMPSLAWMLINLFSLERSLEIGVILVGCVPGAMASNVLTLIARGNVSYSVGLTTSATLVSPVIVPLAMKLTLGATADPQLLLNTAVQLCLTVVLPTLAGFGLSRVSTRFSNWSERWAGRIANLCILWIIAVVMAKNRQILGSLSPSLLGILLLLNLGGYLGGQVGGRLLGLTTGMRRALMLEVGMQNAGLGASLATSLFPDQPGVALPCGLFAFGCMLTGTVLAQILSQWPADQELSAAAAANGPQLPSAEL
jgi:BASS family bile acid:Na+ symporter